MTHTSTSGKSFHIKDQSIETLESKEFWLEMCPFLTISTTRNLNKSQTEETVNQTKSNLLTTGFTTINLDLDIKNLKEGILTLESNGFHGTFIIIYDQPWILASQISTFLPTTSFPGDWFIFHTSANSPYKPSGPHRDRPLSPSFDRLAYTTAWIALTEANPRTSHLSFMSKKDDEKYDLEGDDISHINFDNQVDLHLEEGQTVLFSHRVLHWSSKPLLDRISISMAFTTNFENIYYSGSEAFCPSLKVRIGLSSGQVLKYSHLTGLDKDEISLMRRLFVKQKSSLDEFYFDEIMSKIQFMKFMK